MNFRDKNVKYDEIKVCAVGLSDQETLQQVQNLYDSTGLSDVDIYYPAVATFVAYSLSPLILGAATVRHTILNINAPQKLHIECWQATTRYREVTPMLLRAVERYGEHVLMIPELTVDTPSERVQENIQKFGYEPIANTLTSRKILHPDDSY